MNPIHVVDVETTGLDAEVDKVVEIAAVTIDADTLTTGKRWSTLVNPGIPIPPTASAIHHITAKDVAGKPSIEDALAALQSRNRATGPLAAHNAAFDAGFCGGPASDWICTMRVAKHLWPHAPGYGNQVLRYWLELDLLTTTTHRALDDALVTTEILKKQIWHLREQGVESVIEHLLMLTGEPALLRLMPLGKHRDAPWKEVPHDYLQWMSRKEWDDPDITHTLQEALQGRFAA